MQVGVLVKLPVALLERVENHIAALKERPYTGRAPTRTSVVTDVAAAALEAWLQIPLPPIPEKQPSAAELRARQSAISQIYFGLIGKSKGDVDNSALWAQANAQYFGKPTAPLSPPRKPRKPKR